MKRIDELEKKMYPEEYEAVYNYLYNLDIDCLLDCSTCNYNKRKNEIDYFEPNFLISDKKLSYNIRIVDYSHHLFIKVDEKIPFIQNSNYKHEKWELYMFENTKDLLTILKKLIDPFFIGELND